MRLLGWYSILVCSLCFTTKVFAVVQINLNHSPSSVLNGFLPTHSLKAGHEANSLAESRKTIDANGTVHLHVHQLYAGRKVWGGEAVIHIPNQGHNNLNLIKLSNALVATANTHMSGTLYQNLNSDLDNKAAEIFTAERAEDVLNYAIQLSNLTNNATIFKKNKELMVYVDSDKKAHWVFYISIYAKINSFPIAPRYLIDAQNFKIYHSWNDIKRLENITVGGVGGNKKIGKLFYDGLKDHLPILSMQRDNEQNLCYIANYEVNVIDFRTNHLAQFKCQQKSRRYPRLYWNADTDFINDGYSPNNDALYAGKVIKSLYQDWFGLPVLSENNHPMLLKMVTHAKFVDREGNMDAENAAFDPFEQKMYFGDGQDIFYPLTSIGVAAHEISHGFTDQHSQLNYFGESGGLHESFSDMAAQAAEFYANGKSTWQIGSEVLKEKNTSLRYMDMPSKDCNGAKPGPRTFCSIQHINDYYSGMNVHFSSGIFNRVFYLIATHPDWDVKKAFSIMVKANKDYWTPSTTFSQAACDVLHATKDLKYDIQAVLNALADVGIDTSECR